MTPFLALAQVTVDTRLDLNTLIALVGTAATIFWFIVSMKGDIRSVVSELAGIKADVSRWEQRIEAMASNFDGRLQKIGDVLIEVAKQQERLNALDQHINTLRQNLDAINDRLTSVERNGARTLAAVKRAAK